MSDAVLSTDALVMRFGGVAAIDRLSLQVRRGARHALIGPNGAGKTTLINGLTGVLAPTAGRVHLQGRDITRLAAHKRVAGGLVRTFQISQLFDSMTPLQTLALACAQQRGIGARWWQPLGAREPALRRAREWLERFRLVDVALQPVRHLPYGQRRLLELAVAMACEPCVLLLDEPAAGVPAAERGDVLQAVADLPGDVSVLLIEHDMDLVFRFADRITVLVDGRILADGAPQAVANDARVKAAYLGPGEATRG